MPSDWNKCSREWQIAPHREWMQTAFSSQNRHPTAAVHIILYSGRPRREKHCVVIWDARGYWSRWENSSMALCLQTEHDCLMDIGDSLPPFVNHEHKGGKLKRSNYPNRAKETYCQYL